MKVLNAFLLSKTSFVIKTQLTGSKVALFSLSYPKQMSNGKPEKSISREKMKREDFRLFSNPPKIFSLKLGLRRRCIEIHRRERWSIWFGNQAILRFVLLNVIGQCFHQPFRMLRRQYDA